MFNIYYYISLVCEFSSELFFDSDDYYYELSDIIDYKF